jgi:hypothetical protein
MAFGYYSPVTVNSAQVPSTQTNFPMLVSYTDARLKTVGNGGHVQNSSGYDIRPYDGIGGSAMTYELERYNASTGEVIMWVKVPSLAVASVVYLYYGDSGISTDGSSTSTWNTNFSGVYHLKDGTTLSGADSTSNAFTLTNSSATATAGQIDGGVNLTTGQYMTAGNHLDRDLSDPWTIAFWINSTSSSGANIISKQENSGSFVGHGVGYGTYLGTPGLQIFMYNGTGIIGTIGSTFLSAWHRVVATYNGNSDISGMKVYVDGSSQSLNTNINAGAGTFTNAADFQLNGRAGANNTFPGKLDEVNILTVALSADWITTDYNNQSAPSTFATLGTEVAVGGATVNSGFFFAG